MKLTGFRATDISILFPENEGTKDLAMKKSSKAPEGTAAGAGSGGVVGGVIGWLAGAGVLAVPGVGIFIAAGPIMSLLSGIGVSGVIAGLAGALVGWERLSMRPNATKAAFRKGGILLSVHRNNSDWIKTARVILQQTGAEDVSYTNEAKADFAANDRPRPRTVERRA